MVKSPQAVTKEEEEEDPRTSGPSSPSTSLAPSPPLAESHSAQSTTLLGLKHYNSAGSLGSLGSMNSVYSAAGGKGDYDIAGEVLVGVEYKGGQLLVHVGGPLTAMASLTPTSRPTCFQTRASTQRRKLLRIKKKTLDPVYNETLKVHDYARLIS